MLGGKKEKDPCAIGMPRGEMASGKGDFSKVRKSLAWNKAFFTEEGVLDSMELSLLNGSVSMPDDSSLSRNHDVSTTLPFTSSTKIRSNTSRLQPIRETPEMGTQTRRRNIDSSPKSLFSDSNSVARGQPPIHRKQEKATEGKNSCRNILLPPVANSQKRIANTSVSTTTSKIPKHKGGNLSVPKPLKNSPQSSKTSKTGQTIPTINDHRNKQSVGARSTRLSENRKPSSIQSIPNKSAKIKAGQTPLNNILQTRTNSDLTLHPKPPRPENSTPFCEVTQNHKFITPSSVIEGSTHQALPVKSLAMPSALRKPSPSLGFFHGRKTPSDVGKARNTQDALSSTSGKTHGCTKQIITTDTSNSSSTKLNMKFAIKSGTESPSLKRTMLHNSSAAKNSTIRIENSEKLLVAEHINKQDKEKNFGLPESTDSKKIGTKLHQQHILKPKSSSESNISGEEKCSVEQIDSFSQACCEKNTVDVEHCQSNDSNCNVAVNEASTSSGRNEPDHEVLIGNDYSDDQTNELVQEFSSSKPIINIKNTDSVKNEYAEPVHLDDVQTKINISKRKCAALDPEPFTDEWIAARVAFGEDILTKKGGAVQNSPTEKILPEPSPWSPVKRKNQDVGPYDCTKYTKCI